MKINSINNLDSFRSITPIVATEKGKQALVSALEQSKGKYFLDDLTGFYKGQKGNGLLTTFAKLGRKILFLTTGKECEKILYMKNGFTADTVLTRHMNYRRIVRITENSHYYIDKLVKRTQVK